MRKYMMFFLVLVLFFLTVSVPAGATEPDEQYYSDLFHQPSTNQSEQEIADAFLASPEEFVHALSMEKYGTQVSITSLITSKWAAENHRKAHKEALLALAERDDLTQAERRVVKWMLENGGIRDDYTLWGETVDYRELFSRGLEMDGALPAYFAMELQEAFRTDPAAFIRELAMENAQLRENIAWILMEKIYYDNYDREEVAAILGTLKDSGKMDDTQLQVIGELWDAAAYLTDLYGPPPVKQESTDETEASDPTDATVKSEPEETVPQRDKPVNDTSSWILLAVLGVAVLAIVDVVLIVPFVKKK